jgi:deoxyribodipyrimidine photo-lyase
MNEQRIRGLSHGKEGLGPVVYWMSRDQRLEDNWALLYAQQLALQKRQPLAVVFCLVPDFLGATWRQYGFMLKGLKEAAEGLKKKSIPFFLLAGKPEQEIPNFLGKNRVSHLVTDFDPLRIKRQWKTAVARKISLPFSEVDAHNIVPCWIASPKQEYGAYTIRPKIHRLLDEFLEDFPTVVAHPYRWQGPGMLINWLNIFRELVCDRRVAEVPGIIPGGIAAHKSLQQFIQFKLSLYDLKRNDPVQDGQSNLSPYLHFGQLSGQRVVLEVLKTKLPQKVKDQFLEEIIIRRELSDNFCLYNSDYDNPNGLPSWAKETLTVHRKDKREHLYSLKTFEQAATHDDLWNAAQRQMVHTGKMHGYLRMYWAKKILEWTSSVSDAFQIAIYLNDRYELDGRDPNGYTGIAWSIGGVHDRAWPQRPIFGKIRYMSYGGCKAKFDIVRFIQQYEMK